MRARKLAFNADSLEEYVQKSSTKTPSFDFPQISSAESKQRAARLASLHSANRQVRAASPKAKNTWVDFEYNKASNDQGSSGDDSNDTNDNSLDNITQEVKVNHVKPVRKPTIKQCMILGGSETGKHALVNSMFDEQENVESIKQAMDLVIKSDMKNEKNNKYKFWIANVDQIKHEEVVKAYYKIASVFFFVYSTTDRKSFESAEKAIQQVIQAGTKGFVGVLVGTKADLNDSRSVSLEEGLLLQEKYGMKHFSETSQADDSVKQLFETLNL